MGLVPVQGASGQQEKGARSECQNPTILMQTEENRMGVG